MSQHNSRTGSRAALAAPLNPVVEPLKAERVQLLMKRLTHWRLGSDRKSIFREFRFPDTGSARAFVTLVSAIAAETGHSPTLLIEGNRVLCKLTTPAVGGLSTRDFALARQISLQGGSPPGA